MKRESIDFDSLFFGQSTPKTDVLKDDSGSSIFTNDDIDAMFSGRNQRVVDKWRKRVENADFDDEQPSVKEVFSGEFKSPPALEGGYAVHGVFQLVGHGKRTNDRCGTFRKFAGCTRVELHNKVIFDKKGALVNCAGKGYVKPVFHSCDKPSCPVCYERGWAIRQARSIEFRLEQASKRFGLAEHVICSVPVRDYSLSFEALRKKAVVVLKGRGVVGGVLIFHGFRYTRFDVIRDGLLLHPRGWFWSPHFHVLGFILGGYARCRSCEHRKCVGYGNFGKCDGFEARTRKLFENDGYIVKVKGKRKTVFGTAWYQLHHSSIDVTKKRFHVATWFGVVSYRKLKISKELRKEYDKKHGAKCPICGLVLVPHGYHGHKVSVIALVRKRRGARERVDGFFDKASDWSEVPVRSSVSYGE